MAAMKTASPQEAVDHRAEVTPTGMRRMVNRYNGAKAYRWWAVIGGISLAIFAVQFALWFGSGNFKPTPNGATEVPTYMRVAVRAFEALNIGICSLLIYWYIVRPWRRERALTLEGLMCLALPTMFWQDPLSLIFRVGFTYNTSFVQFGSWANFLPGWSAPRGNYFAEPILWEWMNYLAFFMPGIIFTVWLMRKAKAKWPNLGVAGLAGVAFATMLVLDTLIEPIFCIVGLYSFPGAIRWASLFSGTYYQFPMNEPVFLALFWAPCACLLYFRDDHGHTFVERGIQRLPISNRRKLGLRYLALVGFYNLALLLCYNIPQSLMWTVGDPYPKDYVERSYFTNGLCGPGTPYECPTSEHRFVK